MALTETLITPEHHFFIVLGRNGAHHDGVVYLHDRAIVEGAIFVPNDKIRFHKGVRVTQLTAYEIEIDKEIVLEYDSGLMNLNSPPDLRGVGSCFVG